MIHRIFIFLALLLLLPDLYIHYQFIKPATSRRKWLRWLYWIPSLLLLLPLIALLFGDNFTSLRILITGYYMILYKVVTVPKCLFVICSLVGKALSLIGCIIKFRFLCSNLTKAIFNTIGVLSACAGAIIIIYGSTYGWRRYEVKEVSFVNSQLPKEFDGYRILQISDMHLGTIARFPHEIQRIVDLVNAQEADLIAFTGDLVNNEAKELDDVEHILSQLKAKDGVFSVLGNHDYGIYGQWPSEEAQQQNLAKLKKQQTEMGWQLLLNENRFIHRGNSYIAIIGVENDGNPPFPALGDLNKATRGTGGVFKVLLSHDPTHWKREVLPETNIHLTLSGHTHAMQFRLGEFSPSAWFYPEWSGLYTEDRRGLYVNIGIGSVMIPFRFGAWPEITVITLHNN